ncbi:hypothetical protein ACFPRL_29570 [Pseudoclavibacter helvolus]
MSYRASTPPRPAVCSARRLRPQPPRLSSRSLAPRLPRSSRRRPAQGRPWRVRCLEGPRLLRRRSPRHPAGPTPKRRPRCVDSSARSEPRKPRTTARGRAPADAPAPSRPSRAP